MIAETARELETPESGARAIESPHFPFEHLSQIAEIESWRKEINRPVYHIHKWWAQRLGSVFRAILLGTFSAKDQEILDIFYKPVRLTGTVVFDPFMGSGTTLGEALKLGARVIGRDINPVSYFLVRNALRTHSRRQVTETFRAIERDVASSIRRFYRTRLKDGRLADVLYYFWVKVLRCPRCGRRVDLFSSYIFAQHAYPRRHPQAQVLCPECGALNTAPYDCERIPCGRCRKAFNPQVGPARGATAVCGACGGSFQIVRAVQKYQKPPEHRLYAKMVLRPDGSKEYLPATRYDFALYSKASSLLSKRENAYPVARIQPGYNTDQVLNYSYKYWHEMFNDRQLLCLSFLADRIRAIPQEELRELFTCLFSGILEFNNMFASFKGEGTGAVRHMFSHHILKPERVPLEANPWGTPKSSGSFSTLFETRIVRALDYCENPFEISVTAGNGRLSSEKIYGLSCPLGRPVAGSLAEFQEGNSVYLSCGDSAGTDLPNESVDAVVTDPPFFDNVHYSELADFFYVWQRHILGPKGNHTNGSTRSPSEVQQSDPHIFTERLRSVWTECNRVLRPGGLMVFTYHHSRAEGWLCILEAIGKAGFVIAAAHPIKSEMSVAQPKHQAKEPIDLDVILVCRKRRPATELSMPLASALPDATQEAREQVERFNRTSRLLSLNDVRVVLMAQVLKRLSSHGSLTESIQFLKSQEATIQAEIEHLYQRQQRSQTSAPGSCAQLSLWRAPSSSFRVGT